MKLQIFYSIFLICLCESVFRLKDKDIHWAVLVCGSSGFYNYRHQADVCHAYHILINNGMPKENIIVFSFDDAVNSPQNIYPGKLYNRNDNHKKYNQTDYRKDCNIDYNGTDVTPKSFVNALLGKKGLKRHRKVLKSTSDENVFINFVDHGGSDLIAFPNNKELHAKELISTLKEMHTKQMYKNLVFYMEACESGSMFTKLSNDINVYALTASNATESSWGTYCPPNDDVVKGKHIGACLGDLFSVSWMEDTDGNLDNSNIETLDTQYDHVKEATTKSHVMRYGTLTMDTKNILDFQGMEDDFVPKPILVKTINKNDSLQCEASNSGMVSSRDITFHSLYHQYLNAKFDDPNKDKYFTLFLQEMKYRQKYDSFFYNFIKLYNLSTNKDYDPTQNLVCYKALINSFKTYCIEKESLANQEYVLQYYTYFKQTCNKPNTITSDVVRAIKYLC